MATSGTVSTTVFNTQKVIDRAFGRCKVPPQRITAERIEIANDNLFLILGNLANLGAQLWAREKVILPLYAGLAAIALPVGTVDLRSYNYRSVTRLAGTYVTSAGGAVASAFDDDFDTALTQTSTDGNVSADFTTAVAVTTVGVLPNAGGSWNLVVERSTDNVTWTQVRAIGAVTYVAGTWAWYDLDGAIAARYWRVRETGGGTLDLRELVLGNNPAEIPLYRMNHDDWVNLPTKTFGGRPLQFWLDRKRGDSSAQMEMQTWPVCDLANRYGHLVVWRQRHLEDVGTMTQEIEVPQRWYTAVVLRLAAELAGELPDVPDERENKLTARADRAWLTATQEERDRSPMRINYDIGAYTQ